MGILRRLFVGDGTEGWYPAENPKRVRVYVDSEDNKVYDKWFREDYWEAYPEMSLIENGWRHRAHWSARNFADRVRVNGLTVDGVAYPAHRIHKVVISDYVDSTDRHR